MRRKASTISLFLLTSLIPLWAYGAVHQLRDNYVFRSAQVGRWSSLAVVVVCVFAEKK